MVETAEMVNFVTKDLRQLPHVAVLLEAPWDYQFDASFVDVRKARRRELMGGPHQDVLTDVLCGQRLDTGMHEPAHVIRTQRRRVCYSREFAVAALDGPHK